MLMPGVVLHTPVNKRVWICVDTFTTRVSHVEEAANDVTVIVTYGQQTIVKESFDEVLRKFGLDVVDSAATMARAEEISE